MQIGSYQVLFELGRGGMGSVYLARTVGPGGAERLVAIKRARDPVAISGGSADRFLDELRVTAQVHHANVVGMHQAGSDEHGHYLVFDYVEGESLDGLVALASARGDRVPVRVALRVVLDALAGLHAAHETTDTAGRPLGILHRDVSTHNLLVGRDGVTRLADFGIAKSLVSTAVTEQGHVEGKLVYMAPEYVQKLPVDRTLDIYAIGVTLWVALAGQEPWPDSNQAQILRSILMQGVPRLTLLRTEIAPELEAIVMRACSRDAGFRFQSARQMLDELDAFGKKHDGVASHIEVAEYVEAMVGKQLAARRAAIEKSRSGLEQTGAPVPAPALPTTATDGASAGLARDWEKPLPWRGAIYAALGLGVLAIGFAVLSGNGPREPPSEKPAASTPAPVASEPAIVEPPVELAPEAGPAPAFSATTAAPPARSARTPQRQKVSPAGPPPRGRLDQISTANPYQ
jgi:eukaryotic-like serine/threonine-protein kinase